jgi:hypothetical protein
MFSFFKKKAPPAPAHRHGRAALPQPVAGRAAARAPDTHAVAAAPPRSGWFDRCARACARPAAASRRSSPARASTTRCTKTSRRRC